MTILHYRKGAAKKIWAVESLHLGALTYPLRGTGWGLRFHSQRPRPAPSNTDPHVTEIGWRDHGPTTSWAFFQGQGDRSVRLEIRHSSLLVAMEGPWRTVGHYGLDQGRRPSPVRIHLSHPTHNLRTVDTSVVPNLGPRHSGRAELTRSVSRARMFLISYVPLFGILTIRFDGRNLRCACLALCVIGVVDLLQITIRIPRSSQVYPIEIMATEDTGGEVSGYLASYLLPFVTVSTPSARDLLGYGIFLIVALVIFIRSDLIRINPTFYLLGYRVLKVRFGEQGTQYLLTRVEPRAGETINVADVAGIVMKARNHGSEP